DHYDEMWGLARAAVQRLGIAAPGERVIVTAGSSLDVRVAANPLGFLTTLGRPARDLSLNAHRLPRTQGCVQLRRLRVAPAAGVPFDVPGTTNLLKFETV